jgi:uncharacterized damage-inducible protein DinB
MTTHQIAPRAERPRVPRVADERTMLLAWLEFHRATLLMKCAELDESQLKLRATPPSTLSLLGLVRHMTEVERSWFRRRIAGEQAPPLYYTPDREDDDFDALDDTPVGEVFARYTRELDLCRDILVGVSLDSVVGEYSVRWIVTHMLEEYARHNGHADLLREAIDGARGD